MIPKASRMVIESVLKNQVLNSGTIQTRAKALEKTRIPQKKPVLVASDSEVSIPIETIYKRVKGVSRNNWFQ